jgi:hypothetical protein
MAKEFDPDIGKATRFSKGEQQAIIAQKGGAASVESKRRKKTLADRVRLFGELKVDAKSARAMEQLGIAEEEQDRYMQAAVSLFQKALKGDVSAFNAIRDIIGEKPVERQQVNAMMDTQITIGYVETGIEPVDSEDKIR